MAKIRISEFSAKNNICPLATQGPLETARPQKTPSVPHLLLRQHEGTAQYAGHILAPAESFGIWPRLFPIWANKY